MTVKRWLLAMAAVVPMLASAACETISEGAPQQVKPGTTGTVDLDGRPFRLHVPASYAPAAKMPLLVALHGFTSQATELESYFKLTAESDRRGFLLALPDGTKDRQGRRFWNATEACCDFGRTGTDDSAYLSRLVDTVTAAYAVDTRRVYFVGHSNGGYMSYRMACEHAAQITAIMSLAGMANADAAACKPARPVSVLHVHGTDDRTVLIEGGANAGRSYPSLDATLAQWRGHNGCTGQADTSAPPMDLEAGLPGPETTVTSYRSGCRDATRVDLWSMKGAGHVPSLTATFTPAMVDFLLNQVAPA